MLLLCTAIFACKTESICLRIHLVNEWRYFHEPDHNEWLTSTDESDDIKNATVSKVVLKEDVIKNCIYNRFLMCYSFWNFWAKCGQKGNVITKQDISTTAPHCVPSSLVIKDFMLHTNGTEIHVTMEKWYARCLDSSSSSSSYHSVQSVNDIKATCRRNVVNTCQAYSYSGCLD